MDASALEVRPRSGHTGAEIAGVGAEGRESVLVEGEPFRAVPAATDARG